MLVAAIPVLVDLQPLGINETFDMTPLTSSIVDCLLAQYCIASALPECTCSVSDVRYMMFRVYMKRPSTSSCLMARSA
jgi:hypothetical protein